MTYPIFSPSAQKDLDDIYEYTIENWGITQAERYLLQLRDTCYDLAQAKKQGQKVDHIRRGYLRIAEESHFIFYRHSSTITEIIRILHQRMSFKNHFL